MHRGAEREGDSEYALGVSTVAGISATPSAAVPAVGLGRPATHATVTVLWVGKAVVPCRRNAACVSHDPAIESSEGT